VIVFPPGVEFNTSPLSGLSELRSLTLSAPVGLQLSHFKKLTEFSGYWHKDLELSGSNNIERLDISGYKEKTGDLTTFPDLPFLKHLALTQCSIASLRGISKLPLLISLSVAYSSKLEDLDEIGMLTNLEVLDFQKCPRMKQYGVFRSLKNLRVLRVNSCGEIPSLSFINEMPRLEEFRFVHTNVADGNLTPLLRLERVGFLPKRHYSHKPDQFTKQ
jgi:Leucine-rich repeat (LRR) protein